MANRRKARRAAKARHKVWPLPAGRRWSQRVTETSDALDLEPNVFKLRSPRAIALSLKRSAEKSKRRRAEPFRSAMAMLIFYVNRAGRNLRVDQRRVLDRAKVELRKVFGREPASRVRCSGSARTTRARCSGPAKRR